MLHQSCHYYCRHVQLLYLVVAQRLPSMAVREPVTITTTKQTYPNVTLPYVVKVNRHKIDGQRIYVQSETTRYKDIVLEKATNGWAFGNILIGGLIGWGIDLGTNAVSKPAQKHFYINANDVQGGPTQQNTTNNNNNN